jgi:hypothetical protein
MRTRQWQSLLTEQARIGKVLFTLTELANIAGVTRRVVNVEMTRLVKYGVVTRYAKGLYGLPGNTVLPEQLLPCMDAHAYVTGAYVLMQHGFVTQVSTVITCFTSRRHYSRNTQTSIGRFEFVCVKPPIYRREVQTVAGAEQALCDFVYIMLRRRVNPASVLTFRRLTYLKRSLLTRTAKRYPNTVRRYVAALMKDQHAYQ